MSPEGVDIMIDPRPVDPVEVVRKALGLRSRKVLDQIWVEYPEPYLWEELLGAIKGAHKPSVAFVRAVLKDRKRRSERHAAQNTLIKARTGTCAGCGVLNCQGPKWSRCPWKTGAFK